jgi:acyl dehydratase
MTTSQMAVWLRAAAEGERIAFGEIPITEAMCAPEGGSAAPVRDVQAMKEHLLREGLTEEQALQAIEEHGSLANAHVDRTVGRPLVPGPQLIAIVSETLTDAFGMGWVAGGRLFLRFHKPVFVNDTLLLYATLKERSWEAGRTRLTFDIAGAVAGDDTGERITGEASALDD